MKRYLIFALIFSLLLVSLCGCNKQSANDSGETTSGTEAPITDGGDERYDANGYLLDDLPDELNYGGEVVNVLHWTETDVLEFNPDVNTKDVIEKSLIERDNQAATRLNVEFNWIPTNGHWQSENAFVDKVANSMLEDGENRFDIIATYSQSAALISTLGYVMDLSGNQYLDLEKPWWPNSLVETFTVEGNLFFVSGDISLTFLTQAISTIFNKELLADRFPNENLYSLVDNNQWTYEKMLTLAQEFYIDRGETGTKDGEDRFGVLCPWEIYLDGFFYGSDMITVDHDSDDTLHVNSDYVGLRGDDLAEKLKALFHTTNVGYLQNTGVSIDIFANGEAAFMIAPASTIMTYLLDSDVDYGVLPMPKYDTLQEEYKTVCTNLTSLYCISANSTEEQAKRAGAVLECLASEGYRRVSPTVFDKCLKSRYAKDGETGRMYDIIRAGVTFDIGRVYGRAALHDVTQVNWQRVVIDGNRTWGAQSASVDALLQEYLNDLTTTIRNQ